MILWPLEGARMGSHKTCHFPIISLKHLWGSISPYGPWIPPLLREKWSFPVWEHWIVAGKGPLPSPGREQCGQERALQSPIHYPSGTRAATCVSWSVVSQGWCLSKQSSQGGGLQDINVLRGLGREGCRRRGSQTLIWALPLYPALQILTSSAGSQTI